MPRHIIPKANKVSNLIQISRFLIVGGMNTLVDFAVYSFLVLLIGGNPSPSNVISYSCGAAFSFVLNRTWTFKSDRYARTKLHQAKLFALATLVGLSVSTLIVWVLAEPVGAIPAKIASVGITTVVNFMMSKYIVFRSAEGN